MKHIALILILTACGTHDKDASQLVQTAPGAATATLSEPQATSGKDGKDGVDGKDGLAGKDGVDGKNGVDGLAGKDGKDAKPRRANAVFAWDATENKEIEIIFAGYTSCGRGITAVTDVSEALVAATAIFGSIAATSTHRCAQLEDPIDKTRHVRDLLNPDVIQDAVNNSSCAGKVAWYYCRRSSEP